MTECTKNDKDKIFTIDNLYFLFIINNPSEKYKSKEKLKLILGTILLIPISILLGDFFFFWFMSFNNGINIKNDIYIILYLLSLPVGILLIGIIVKYISSLFNIRHPAVAVLLSLMVLTPTLKLLFSSAENAKYLGSPFLFIIFFTLSFICFAMIWSTSLPSDFHRRLFIIIFVIVIIITFYIADSLNPLIILSLLSFVTYGAVWRKKEYYREKKGRILIESIQDPISLSYIACNTSNFLMGFFALDKIQEDWLRHKIQREAKSEEICTYASGIQVFKIPDAWYHYPPLNTVSCPNCLGIGHKTEFYTSAMNQSSNDYGAGDIKEINTVCSFCDGSGKIRV